MELHDEYNPGEPCDSANMLRDALVVMVQLRGSAISRNLAKIIQSRFSRYQESVTSLQFTVFTLQYQLHQTNT